LLALLSYPTPRTTAADSSFAGTGYLIGVPVPGVVITNASGQVKIQGNVHVLRVQTDNPKATGRLQAAMDLAYQADGTAIFAGTAVQEVGTWDLTDPANPRFIPTGGVWDLVYRGVTQADNSSVVKMSGIGIGGTIEGQQLTETVARGPGIILDPTVPYVGNGTVSTAPKDFTTVIDNFDQPPAPYWSTGSGNGRMQFSEKDGHLVLRGEWPSAPTWTSIDTTAFASPMQAWVATAGRTLETRVDIVSLDGPNAGAVVALYHDSGQGYWVVKSGDYVAIGKQYSNQIFYSAHAVKTPNHNVVLTLSLTPSGPNVQITARVLDGSPAGTVLYEHSVIDTPNSDHTLSASEIQAAIGLKIQQILPDPKIAPWTQGTSPMLGVFQFTDGTLPAAQGTFDNYKMCSYATPQVAVERTVRLAWPESESRTYGVESAPTAQGPWLPVGSSSCPGFHQLTLPAVEGMQFFRVRTLP
jgi:hypothetical protein